MLAEADAWDHQRYCIMQDFDDPRRAPSGEHDAWTNARLAEYKSAAPEAQPRMRVRMIADGLHYKLRTGERSHWPLYGNMSYGGVDMGYAMPTAHNYVTLAPNTDFQVQDFTVSKWAGIRDILNSYKAVRPGISRFLGTERGIGDALVDDDCDTHVREPVDNSMFVMPSDVGAALRKESPIGLGAAQGGWGGYED